MRWAERHHPVSSRPQVLSPRFGAASRQPLMRCGQAQSGSIRPARMRIRSGAAQSGWGEGSRVCLGQPLAFVLRGPEDSRIDVGQPPAPHLAMGLLRVVAPRAVDMVTSGVLAWADAALGRGMSVRFGAPEVLSVRALRGSGRLGSCRDWIRSGGTCTCRGLPSGRSRGLARRISATSANGSRCRGSVRGRDSLNMSCRPKRTSPRRNG